MMPILISAAPLGLNLIEILIHLFNILILVVVVRFLLYKPIKKFMAKRAQEYATQADVAEQTTGEAKELKEKYENLLDNAKKEAVKITEDALAVANANADSIICEAKKKASVIIEKAEEEIKIKEAEEKESMAGAISELAVAMATKIIDREFRQKDNDAVINLLVGEWKKG
ncbi:MAG: F0F1 ATP synthase subunit B [Christensenellaceae bacterium]|jgi:F-type H+-transporting ATPase subunit b|nr:F0F1 ATP synthase subunit B [Christensenellaceae bacterium]